MYLYVANHRMYRKELSGFVVNESKQKQQHFHIAIRAKKTVSIWTRYLSFCVCSFRSTLQSNKAKEENKQQAEVVLKSRRQHVRRK